MASTSRDPECTEALIRLRISELRVLAAETAIEHSQRTRRPVGELLDEAILRVLKRRGYSGDELNRWLRS